MNKQSAMIFGILAISACQEQEQVVDGQEVLRATVEQVIMPNIEQLHRTSQDIQAYAEDFCANPSSSNLQTLRFSWKGGKKMLKNIEILNFGPYNYIDIDVSRSLDNWPERKEGIERIISEDNTIDAQYLQDIDRPDVSSGYPAMGYLLHSHNDDEMLEVFSDSRRCAYLLAQAQHNQDIVARFYEAWSPEHGNFAKEVYGAGSGSSTFSAPRSAIAALLSQIDNISEHMASIKLAQPLDMARSEAVEASFSGNSLQDLYSNLEAMEDLYTGASPSLSDYVVSFGQEDLDNNIRKSFSDIRSALDAIPSPLSQAISSHPEEIARVVQSLETLCDLLEHDAQQFLMYEESGY